MPDTAKVQLRKLESRENYLCSLPHNYPERAHWEYILPKVEPPISLNRVHYFCNEHIELMLNEADRLSERRH